MGVPGAINEPIGMAVTLRDGRWAHLTTEPGPDVVPIHKRQPAILRLSDWRRFLTDPARPADLMAPTPMARCKPCRSADDGRSCACRPCARGIVVT